MDPTTSPGENSLKFLHELAKNPVFKSDNSDQTVTERFAIIHGLLDKLDKHLDFIVSTSRFFDSTPKRLNKVFKLVGDQIQRDEIEGHQLALKCHSMLCKIISKNPSIIEYAEIPRIISEAHYDHRTRRLEAGTKGLEDLDPPSKLDLYRLADTDRAKEVENDFIHQISTLPYPIKENSRELFDAYETLSIAAQKNYPELGIACLNKLTASQIMTFLSLTYGPEKQTVKELVVDNLKMVKKEDPAHYKKIMEKILTFVDKELDTKKPWDELAVRIAEDILDVSISLGATEIIEKVYTVLKTVDYVNQQQLFNLCTSEQFPPFASQFAMYYTLTKNMFPSNFKEINNVLQQMINQIMLFRMTPAKKLHVSISPQDPRFLKQLVQAIVDLKDWNIPGNHSSLRPELVYENLPFTSDDIEQLALLEPKKITINKHVFSQLGSKKWLPWKREKSRFTTLRGSSQDTVIVTN